MNSPSSVHLLTMTRSTGPYLRGIQGLFAVESLQKHRGLQVSWYRYFAGLVSTLRYAHIWCAVKTRCSPFLRYHSLAGLFCWEEYLGIAISYISVIAATFIQYIHFHKSKSTLLVEVVPSCCV